MRVAIAALIFFNVGFGKVMIADAELKEGEANFVRNDKVLAWQTVNSGRFDLSGKMILNLDSNLRTSLNMATGSSLKDRWYDSVYNKAELEYAFSDKMGMTFSAREDWNRDTFSRFGKSLLTTSVDSNIEYRPFKSVNLAAGVGQLYDRRFENEDSGTNINGKMLFDSRPAENLYTSVDISGNTSNLKRSNDLLRIRSKIDYYHKLAMVSLGFEDNRRIRGYFSDVDRRRIEERERVERNLSLLLSRGSLYNYRNATAFEMSMAVGAKRIDDSANSGKENETSSKYKSNSKGDIRDFGLKIARGIGKRVLVQWGAGYQYDDNIVERRLRSRTQTDIVTRGEIGIGIGRSDSLSIIGWIKRSKIDTPVGVPNDRDELKIECGARYSREFSNNFKTGLDFRLLETHYVNIDASQSSQNKWIKTYQFSPSLVYSPVRSVLISHRVNLYANQMDYDFDSDTNPRSNITRRVSTETWMDAEVSSRTKITLGFMFEENDYGNLDRENWKLPVEEGIRRFGDISVEYKLADWITLSPMYIYAIRRDSDIEMNDIIRREVDQTYGIDFNLFNSKKDNYSFVMSAKRIVRVTNKYPVRIRDYIDMKMRYIF